MLQILQFPNTDMCSWHGVWLQFLMSENKPNLSLSAQEKFKLHHNLYFAEIQIKQY